MHLAWVSVLLWLLIPTMRNATVTVYELNDGIIKLKQLSSILELLVQFRHYHNEAQYSIYETRYMTWNVTDYNFWLPVPKVKYMTSCAHAWTKKWYMINRVMNKTVTRGRWSINTKIPQQRRNKETNMWLQRFEQ